MDRRDFLKGASASGLGLALSQPHRTAAAAGSPPNILFILVDEMRFPTVFPEGVHSPEEFLRRFMPNTYSLWQDGVKFTQHFTAATACTPGRGVLVTGLYSQQSWMLQTLKGGPDTKPSPPFVIDPPVLDPGFPTYGKLLRQAGYQTPYIGKWHLSLVDFQNSLQPYGFDGMTKPDPTGANLQGSVGDPKDGYLSDSYIGKQAVDWLNARRAGDQPWCLTVSFQNPHDHEFFWAGTEFKTYNELFNKQSTYEPFTFFSKNKGTPYPPVVPPGHDILNDPNSYGYPVLPPNWESAAQLAANKPTSQTFLRTFSEAVFSGGASEDTGQSQFSIVPYPPITPSQGPLGIAVAPFSYWQRSLDCYTQVLQLVDAEIGKVLQAMRPSVRSNTMIVFTSDHGDYVGSHGLISNKAGTGYDEAIHVPLIVVDPTGRFANDVGTPREELTSSVDLLNLLVTIGNNGSLSWLNGTYQPIYGNRHDMTPMLMSPSAPGRPFVLLATDELVPATYNFNDSPLHILAYRSKTEKLVTYANWTPTGDIDPATPPEIEFYDYATAGGRAETNNTPDDPRVPALLDQLLSDLLPSELRAPLPGTFGTLQNAARARYLAFADVLEHPPAAANSPEFVKSWLGFGFNA